MAKILIFTEAQGESVKSATLEILGKAQGHQLEVVTLQELKPQGYTDLAKYGASKIHFLKGIAQYSPENYAAALKGLIDDVKPDYVFAGATSLVKDLFPRLAGMCQAGMVSDVTNFIFEGDTFHGTRPLFSGKCLAKVEIVGPKPHFASMRPNSLGLVESPKAGAGEKVEAAAKTQEIRAVIQEIIKSASSKLDLTEANIIVSGGRAMKNKENFQILDDLAEVIGATVGASRAAVDSGYASHSMQVGQTGKTVSPSLYIACGISGAIQHLAGMRTSKVIVAINTDPDAPIFTKADYGIVGDLFQIVPLLKEEFKKLLGK
jgi:electron transfer flavoprotein alpha subunit